MFRLLRAKPIQVQPVFLVGSGSQYRESYREPEQCRNLHAVPLVLQGRMTAAVAQALEQHEPPMHAPFTLVSERASWSLRSNPYPLQVPDSR